MNFSLISLLLSGKKRQPANRSPPAKLFPIYGAR